MVDVNPYLSYAREAGALPAPGQALDAHFKQKGHQLIYDEADVGIARHEAIEAFIHRLAESPLAVFLLSDRYFRSIWCVRELTKFVRAHKHPQYHGIFVRVGGWPDGVKKLDDYLRTEFQQEQLDYWREFAKQHPQHQQRVNEVIECLPSTLEFLASFPIGALEEEGEVNEVFTDARRYAERMQFVVDVPADDDYRQACEFAIQDYLRRHPTVVPEFVSALRRHKRPTEDHQIARTLLQLDGTKRLQRARAALRQYMSRPAAEIEGSRESLSELVALLLFTVVRHDLYPQLRNARDQLSYVVVADKSDTDVAFVLSARAHQDPVGDMELTEGRLESNGCYTLVRREVAKEDIADAQLKEIWRWELSDEAIPSGKDELIRRLRRKMASNYERGIPRFLLVEPDSAVNHPFVLQQLKHALPQLLIFELGAPSDREDAIRPLCPELDGAMIRDEVNDFASILSPRR